MLCPAIHSQPALTRQTNNGSLLLLWNGPGWRVQTSNSSGWRELGNHTAIGGGCYYAQDALTNATNSYRLTQ